MQCLKRNGCYCTDDTCPVNDPEQAQACLVDKQIKSFGGLCPVADSQKIREILLDGISDIEEAVFQVDCKMKNQGDRYDIYNFLFCVPFNKTKAALKAFDFPNFTYDRKTQYTFVNFRGGAHDSWNELFYWLAELKECRVTESEAFKWGSREAFCMSEYAEKFITSGYGFFSSSVYKGLGIPRARGYPITCSKEHKLTFQEKKVFEEYGFDYLD